MTVSAPSTAPPKNNGQFNTPPMHFIRQVLRKCNANNNGSNGGKHCNSLGEIERVLVGSKRNQAKPINTKPEIIWVKERPFKVKPLKNYGENKYRYHSHP